MRKIIIAIDGYSSCGKSTMAKNLAKEIGYVYVDTGAMYRAVTLFALRKGFFKTDDEVEIINKDLHICSLGPDATLNMEITMSRGRGYVPAERNKTPQTPIGVIPVDSLYSPHDTGSLDL